jgi:hypothetical protein
MGGYGSGRKWGKPTADASLRVDIAWMLRRGFAKVGQSITGNLSWSRGDQPAGNVGYTCDLRDPDKATLVLFYTITDNRSGEEREYKQRIGLSYTVPHYGGKRWWMNCPVNGARVAKLYMPQGAEAFASRAAWRLGYRSQRVSGQDAAFERLFRLQRKLGCEQGWGHGITRPKGMHHRTFDRHCERYWELDDECGRESLLFLERIGVGLNLEF